MPDGLSRREFLAFSAAGASSLAMGRAFADGERSAPLRVALIGCGVRGRAQMARLCAAGARVVLAVDPSRDNREAALRAGASCAVADAAEGLDEIDGVLIAAPDGMHAPLAALALAQGKHVYVERPLAVASRDAHALQTAARSRGLVVAVGAETVGLAGWRAAAEVVARGEAGPLRWVQVNDASGARGTRFAEGGWREDPAQYAGAFAEPFFDMLAPVTALLVPGALVKASAAGGTGPVPGHMMVTLRYASGVTVVLHTGMPASDGALAVLRGREASVRVFPTHAEVWPEKPGAPAHRVDASPIDSLRCWLAAMRGDGTCAFGLDAARHTQEALDAARVAFG